ncbi:hypothetical protein [Cyclobacterium plantarum]|uniref:Uncharacterized protein n=1 Tax=Cyclobacterium plantarum TaxID=2716263 RepID=A0ABX0H8K6_9BACT|nr:hypothetical protein [Cyclobacterium plantarum]NHE56551.1 hypothetical protein [Cyclobacterium plantarum]
MKNKDLECLFQLDEFPINTNKDQWPLFGFSWESFELVDNFLERKNPQLGILYSSGFKSSYLIGYNFRPGQIYSINPKTSA